MFYKNPFKASAFSWYEDEINYYCVRELSALNGIFRTEQYLNTVIPVYYINYYPVLNSPVRAILMKVKFS